jgi:hypothetical protein
MSRYDSEKRKYLPTASRMTSGSNCRHFEKTRNRRREQEHRIRLSDHSCKVATLPFDRGRACRANLRDNAAKVNKLRGFRDD